MKKETEKTVELIIFFGSLLLVFLGLMLLSFYVGKDLTNCFQNISLVNCNNHGYLNSTLNLDPFIEISYPKPYWCYNNNDLISEYKFTRFTEQEMEVCK